MGKWYGADEDGRDDFWTSGSDDGYDGISGMGGFGGYGYGDFEEGNGVTYGNGREKSDAALRRQEEAEAKFKALAQGTPANLSGRASPLQAFPRKEAHGGGFRPRVQQLRLHGTAQTFELLSPDPKLHLTEPCWRDFKKYVGGWKGWEAKRRLQKPGNETESNGSSASATNAVAKGKKLYVIEVCLAAAAAAPAAKPSAGGATKVQKPKAAKPLAGAVAKEKKPKGPKAPKATAPKASPAAASSYVAGAARRTRAPYVAGAGATPTAHSADDAAKEEALCLASLAETPAKAAPGEPEKRKPEVVMQIFAGGSCAKATRTV
ncbi:hypothetical protein T484DRAFT_3643167 [Baffinella frigidus]|nr:hypothetical protein T484DRAFT_3643167 [Cryptophyta sp. CCMP2293]